jgi:hypothetical protein
VLRADQAAGPRGAAHRRERPHEAESDDDEENDGHEVLVHMRELPSIDAWTDGRY